MSIQKHYLWVCELERTQLLYISNVCLKPQLAGCVLTGNRSNFLSVESSTAWLFDCPQLPSPLYEAEKHFDRILKKCRDTVMYIDPRTRQNFNYASLVSCENNPQNVIVIDLDTNDQSVLTPNPALRATSMFFEPKQVQSAIIPITPTAQEAGYSSNAEFTNFWNRVFFTKHSTTTLNFLGKGISIDFWATSEQHPTDFYSNPSRNGLNHFMGHPYVIIWFSEVICVRLHITDFIGRMSNLNSRYWL